MKKFFTILTLSIIALNACNDADAPDCLKSGGSVITQEISTPAFTEVVINGEFKVVITDSLAQKVTVVAPENLLSGYNIETVDGVLTITDNNGCDWVRSYDLPTVYIASPNISHITQNGAGVVKSSNALTYPEITLLTVDNSGDYDMSFDNEHVIISNNALSNFYFRGSTELLTVGFFSGDGRCECQNLEAQVISVYHSGTNDMVVNPIERLEGRILSTGNLIFVNNPAQVNISDEGRGKLINKSNG